MKLQRLAGFGPPAAIASGLVVILMVVTEQIGAAVPPSLALAVGMMFVSLLTLFPATLAVALLDLEWLDHPAISAPSILFGLGGTLVALVMPTVIGLSVFAGLKVPQSVPFTLFFLGIGLSLVVHNVEGRRANLVPGALAWIGIACGLAYLVLGALQALAIFTFALVMVWFAVGMAAPLLYVIWAIWLGVHLIRSRATVRVPAAAVVG